MPQLPFLLAGPIVRKATTKQVWLWFVTSSSINDCSIYLDSYDTNGRQLSSLFASNGSLKSVRLGSNVWVHLVVANSGSVRFPTDQYIGYELEFIWDEGSSTQVDRLSELNLGILYPPFPRPVFIIGKKNSQVAHGSCRRPGAHGQDAFLMLDKFMETNIKKVMEIPASLILTGDQIYADDVAVPLFDAVESLALDAFGYTEYMPDSMGNYKSVGLLTRGKYSDREELTNRKTSKIGFTTEDGECHLFSLPEFCAMYMVVWTPELCAMYRVDDGTVDDLKNFTDAVRASRRVMANLSTYMIFDDHEITDDWYLDDKWERKARRNPMARRIMSNGLAAYWCFQAWGNTPEDFDDKFIQTLELYFDHLRLNNGLPEKKPADSTPIIAPAKFENQLLKRHWSFMATTNPMALMVDTRTLRETPQGQTAILSGKRLWSYLERLLRKNGFGYGHNLLMVLPTPFLPHRSMMFGQKAKYDSTRDRYEGDFEFYGNNSQQRAELVYWFKQKFNPAALIIFSGDVHHGFLVSGRYGGGSNLPSIRTGKADWVIRIVQVTSSPIKNVNKGNFIESSGKALWMTDQGNLGESLITQWETQYATMLDGKKILMAANANRLKGKLGRSTYVYENHFCLVNLPKYTRGDVFITFIGSKNGKLDYAKGKSDTINDVDRLVSLPKLIAPLP